jgi:mono/diheme cytochrome c family protein
MKGWLKAAAITTLVLVLLAGGGALLVLLTGAYNVAATEPHWGITRWALGTLQHTSVAARAGDIEGAVPTDSAGLAHGFEHFHHMCVECHAAPGFDRGELGQGMNPRPPRLEEEAHEWSDAELFWITKHGIRLAGMPAFGPTHSDQEIWGIVGFMRALEEMTEADYAERVRGLGQPAADVEESGHSHPPGTPAH